jgi:HEAT repeat protein
MKPVVFITIYCTVLTLCSAQPELIRNPVGSLTNETKNSLSLLQSSVLQRQETITELIAVLNGNYPRQSKLNAAKALGIYRATEGIDALIRNLSYDMDEQALSPDSLKELDDVFPISKALERIGTPAIPALLKKITETDQPKEARVCAKICLAVEGEEIAKLKFQHAIEAESDSNKKAKIQSAMAFLNNTKVNFIVH